jgi:hypothetical protein
MKIDTDDPRLRPEDRRMLLRVAASLARDDAEPLTCRQIYSKKDPRALLESHHKVDRGDL